ncbi:hypothetical protein [Catenuloplanes atrovinosus]|uniref:Uncharacterized protein n=1 Tax=Catenuloplanes atrovinosus TaxID=137266 RepID=A0AAE3YVR6_9ACTN|nr:hypothetical protein [Catenuloplanes atrovinosus]MDR7279430.1 hypothetical protein [Catenuloplanes atrovinosus]
MAIRTWGRVLLTSLGVSLLVGAGQLGIAFGFGVLRFGRAFSDGIENQWYAQLTWIAWFAIVAAVTGALVADRAARRLGHDGGPPALAGLALCSSLGAAGVALITMPAARTAQLTDGTDPAGAVAVAALIGAAAGLPLAALVLWQRAYAWAVGSLVAAAWLLGAGSAVASFGTGTDLPAVRLGVLDPAAFSTGVVQRLAVVVMPSLALVAGATIGAIARRRDRHTAIVATSGLLAPAPLAIAYLAAGPGGATDAYQAAPFWGSLVALAAGMLGSLLAVIAHHTATQNPNHTPPPVRGELTAAPAAPPGSPSPGDADSDGPDTAGKPDTAGREAPAVTPDEILGPVPGTRDTAGTSADPLDPGTPISSIGSIGTDKPVSTGKPATSGDPDHAETKDDDPLSRESHNSRDSEPITLISPTLDDVLSPKERETQEEGGSDMFTPETNSGDPQRHPSPWDDADPGQEPDGLDDASAWAEAASHRPSGRSGLADIEEPPPALGALREPTGAFRQANWSAAFGANQPWELDQAEREPTPFELAERARRAEADRALAAGSARPGDDEAQASPSAWDRTPAEPRESRPERDDADRDDGPAEAGRTITMDFGAPADQDSEGGGLDTRLGPSGLRAEFAAGIRAGSEHTTDLPGAPAILPPPAPGPPPPLPPAANRPAPAPETPAANAPTSGAPISGAPVSATPVSSAPISGAPDSSAPISGGPISSPAAPGMPASSTPASSTPTSGTPISSPAAPGTPIPSTPTSGGPISSPAAPGTPIPSAPTSGAPVSTVPGAQVFGVQIPDTQISGAPAPDAPTSGTPVSGSPVPGVPVPGRPVPSSDAPAAGDWMPAGQARGGPADAAPPAPPAAAAAPSYPADTTPTGDAGAVFVPEPARAVPMIEPEFRVIPPDPPADDSPTVASPVRSAPDAPADRGLGERLAEVRTGEPGDFFAPHQQPGPPQAVAAQGDVWSGTGEPERRADQPSGPGTSGPGDGWAARPEEHGREESRSPRPEQGREEAGRPEATEGAAATPAYPARVFPRIFEPVEPPAEMPSLFESTKPATPAPSLFEPVRQRLTEPPAEQPTPRPADGRQTSGPSGAETVPPRPGDGARADSGTPWPADTAGGPASAALPAATPPREPSSLPRFAVSRPENSSVAGSFPERFASGPAAGDAAPRPDARPSNTTAGTADQGTPVPPRFPASPPSPAATDPAGSAAPWTGGDTAQPHAPGPAAPWTAATGGDTAQSHPADPAAPWTAATGGDTAQPHAADPAAPWTAATGGDTAQPHAADPAAPWTAATGGDTAQPHAPGPAAPWTAATGGGTAQSHPAGDSEDRAQAAPWTSGSPGAGTAEQPAAGDPSRWETTGQQPVPPGAFGGEAPWETGPGLARQPAPARPVEAFEGDGPAPWEAGAGQTPRFLAGADDGSMQPHFPAPWPADPTTAGPAAGPAPSHFPASTADGFPAPGADVSRAAGAARRDDPIGAPSSGNTGTEPVHEGVVLPPREVRQEPRQEPRQESRPARSPWAAGDSWAADDAWSVTDDWTPTAPAAGARPDRPARDDGWSAPEEPASTWSARPSEPWNADPPYPAGATPQPPPPAPAPEAPAEPDPEPQAAKPEKRRRGLFRRRNQPAQPPAAEAVPLRDEEYVDWVSGLGDRSSE